MMRLEEFNDQLHIICLMLLGTIEVDDRVPAFSQRQCLICCFEQLTRRFFYVSAFTRRR